MLTHLRIKNFKSWQDTGDIAFGRITAFFGTNSSGKSALLRFLMMLKQTVESNDQQQILHTGDRNSYVDMGTFFDFIYQRNPDNKLEFEFGWDPYALQRRLTYRLSVEEQEQTKFAAIIGSLNGKLQPLSVSYTYTDWAVSPKNDQERQITRAHIDFAQGSISFHKETGENETMMLKEEGRERQRGKFYTPLRYIDLNVPRNAEDAADEEFDEIVRHSFIIGGEIEDLFGKTHYLGPLREPPERIYIWGGQAPQDVGRRGELTIAALLSERGREIQPRIAELLVQMGLAHSFKVAPIASGRREHEVLLQLAPDATPVALADVGVGLSQVLPVLVLCWYVPKGSSIIFEQPELHLHPRAQYALADVFIAATRERDVQIILESHSEHLLTRLQRRIAEGNISDEEVCLYFTALDDTGTSQLERLAMDEYGNITNFPPDFFGNDLAELGAMLEAEIARSSTSSDDSA